MIQYKTLHVDEKELIWCFFYPKWESKGEVV